MWFIMLTNSFNNLINTIKKLQYFKKLKIIMLPIILFTIGIFYISLQLINGNFDHFILTLVYILLFSNRITRFLYKIPYLRGIAISYKNLENYALVHNTDDLFWKKSLLEHSKDKKLNKGRWLVFKWILSQIPLAIIISIFTTFMSPIVYAFWRSGGKYTIFFLVVQLIKAVANAFIISFILNILFILLIILPILIFKWCSLSDTQIKAQITINEKLFKSDYNIRFAAISYIIFGTFLLVSFNMDWVDLKLLSEFFELNGTGIKYSIYTGSELMNMVFRNNYASLILLGITGIFFIYGVSLLLKKIKFKVVVSSKNCLTIFDFNWLNIVLNPLRYFSVLIINLFSTILIGLFFVSILFFPYYLGIPKIFRPGIFIFFVITIAFQLFHEDLFESKSKKILKIISYIIMFVFLGIGLYKFNFIIKNKEVLANNNNIQFNSIFDGIKFYLFENDGPPIPLNSNNSKTSILIPAGWYLSGEVGNLLYDDISNVLNSDTTKGRWQYLSNFEIGKYEVSTEEYEEFLKDTIQLFQHKYCDKNEPKNKSHFPSYWFEINHLPPGTLSKTNESERYPVVGVDWYDAYSYCKWADGRLPKTSEWEKALRGANGKYWPWGDTKTFMAFSNLGSNTSGDEEDIFDMLAPIGVFPKDKSYWGIFDLAGNVSEWCLNNSDSRNDSQPIRGLNWDYSDYTDSPATFLTVEKKTFRAAWLGIRLVK